MGRANGEARKARERRKEEARKGGKRTQEHKQ